MKYIGIDLGGTAIKFGEVNGEGKIVNKWEIDTPSDVITAMADEIRSHYDLTEIAGIGMTVPGPIDANGYLFLCPNVPFLKDCYPAAQLSEKLGGIRCAAGNDGKLAALGEFAFGAARSYDSIIMATVGTALGGGVIIDGQLIYGSHNVAGEISHIHVRDDETVQCGCGGYGCLEQVASGTGLVREAKRALARANEDSSLRSIPEDKLMAKDVCDAAQAGDKLADEVVHFCFGYLGRQFAAMTCIIDPEAFIIGGGVSRAGQYLIDVIDEAYRSELHITKTPAKIVLAELGNDAGILGAAKLVM